MSEKGVGDTMNEKEKKKPELGAGRLRGRGTVFSPNVPESVAVSAWSRSCFLREKM